MLQREKDENFLSYVERVNEQLDLHNISLQDWEKEIIGEHIYGEESLRRCSLFFRKFMNKLDLEEKKMLNDDGRLQSINRAKDELIKERKKLQTINAEAQEYYRFVARNELFNEKIREGILSLEPIEVKYVKFNPDKTNKTGLLCISDLHAGSVYEIKGLYGEVVNKYDFSIMQNRLWRLIGQLEADIDFIDCDDLRVVICGDIFENVLRMSSLTKLKEPVIDTVIKTSEFLCQWISELYKRLYLPIHVTVIGGNHDTLALLGSKPRFEEENLAKLVVKFMELRFSNTSGFITIDPYTDVSVVNIQGTNVMFEHGEDSNLETTIEYFSNLYNLDIDEIYAGHYHRPESKAIGIADVGDRMVYRIGSICGVDTYAKKLRRAARPSAYFAMYDSKEGHTWDRNYYLG